MSSYRKTVEKLAEQEDGRLSCGWCKAPTPREILSQYGARCVRCFETYCATPDTSPGFLTGSKDTPQQAAMRRRVKHGAVNVLKEAA